jgi:serine phosphatase RsbU (regulator of sigma subunit)
MWPEIIYSRGEQSVQNIRAKDLMYWQLLTDQIAEGLYTDIRRQASLNDFSDNISEYFPTLSSEEKSFWNDYASGIPGKFKRLNLFIRPFEEFCRTCIITDNEITILVQMDIDRFCGFRKNDNVSDEPEEFREGESLQSSVGERIRFFNELNCLVPRQLKNNGYEIIRHEEATEINIPMIKKLARAIHSKYLQEVRNQKASRLNDLYNQFIEAQGDLRNQYISEFDELPDEIKYSNIDNAAHIPTKLLAIGYKLSPVRKGFRHLTLHLNEDEIETMAMVEHIRWSWDKRLNGWTYGTVKDEVNKTHPALIPYKNLPDSEKEKDRELVSLIPALLKDIDYDVFPADIRSIRRLSYALKPQSSIHKILSETRELNDQIRKLVPLSLVAEQMIMIRNKKIEEAISEIEGSYSYAQQIQETFLPDDLDVRECFPDSFILFKPKDIVSGDFYFFSRQDHLIIFAVADCTGHGIPGALLSTIGYGIIDQAVNEMKHTDPSRILYHLYYKIHRFLRNDNRESGISDDLDITLCILDITTNVLTYSGVKNPLYHYTNGNVLEYRAQNSAEEFIQEGGSQYRSERIQLKSGDIIYLFSDGYIDQFGGKNHRRYQGSRFKTLLLSINEYPMPEQCDLLYEELEKWRDENHEDQTDDILVIGIRF